MSVDPEDHETLERLVFQPQLHDGANPEAPFFTPDLPFASMLSASCSFNPEIYLRVVMNMVKNPNLTSTHLFRADIFYDSLNDSILPGAPADDLTTRWKSITSECRPLPITIPGFEMKRTIVRQLIPRNPNIDRALTQTCHFLERYDTQSDTLYNLVVYLPHEFSADAIPWYHPAVKALAVRHAWQSNSGDASPPGLVSIYFSFFPDAERTTRQDRTALNFLKIVHKHGEGQRVGYTKRVNHDVIMPQARFQNTYSRLKIQYAKELMNGWVEQTPPEKHVFEDLGIAAFLIELWRDMYCLSSDHSETPSSTSKGQNTSIEKKAFPGFVDVGCGNGILVYILLREGYKGWGFDARRRKTWDALPEWVQSNLKEAILIPEPFNVANELPEQARDNTQTSPRSRDDETHDEFEDGDQTQTKLEPTPQSGPFVNGVFPNSPFIVSNHADELTAWTPLLAYLSQSPFISIPCCSHDLSGARFRARARTKAKADDFRSPLVVKDATPTKSFAAETGSLEKPNSKAPSAFATLCSYVESLACEVGFAPEKEILRIPSTRNTAIVGRIHHKVLVPTESYETRRQKVFGILERELGMGVVDIASAWIDRAHKIARTKGEGH